MDQLLSTIQLDSTEETREVSADVETPQEIDANINPTITYNKGGGIVKSLSYILGDVTFTKGLSVIFIPTLYYTKKTKNLTVNSSF